jgi:hypothetical protein
MPPAARGIFPRIVAPDRGHIECENLARTLLIVKLFQLLRAVTERASARRSDDTDAPSGAASDPMSAGSAFMLPHLNRYLMTATLGL